MAVLFNDQQNLPASYPA